jgi:type I restriction enzyme, S subunit
MTSASGREWRRVRLVDVCQRITVGHVGPMADQYVAEGIVFLRSQNVQPFRIDLTDVKRISPEFHAKIRKSELRPGDVIIVRTGYPGTACVVPESLSVANCADLVIVRPSAAIDPWYLCSIFNSTWGRSTVAGNLVGAAQQHFNVGAAKNLLITLPPIEVQRRITVILSAYDDLIENNTRRITVLEDIARRLYEEWFVPFRFPDHESGVEPSAVPSDMPYVGLEHLPRRSIALREWGTPSVVTSTKLRFRQGDILFGKIRPYLHKVVIAPFDGVCSSDAIVIHAKQPEWLPIVLCCVSSDAFVAHATQTSHGTKMPRANWGVLMRYPIAIPPTELLDRFNDMVTAAVGLMRVLTLASANLRSTREVLLPKLVSGEIDVGAASMPSEVAAA